MPCIAQCIGCFPYISNSINISNGSNITSSSSLLLTITIIIILVEWAESFSRRTTTQLLYIEKLPSFFFLLLVFLEFIIRTTNGINNYPRELIQSQSTDMQVIHTCSSTSFNQMHTTLHSVLTWNFSSKKIEYCCQLISMIPAAAPGTFRHRYIVNCSLTFPLFWWSFVEFLWKMRVKRRKRKEVKKSNNVGINIME